MKKLSFLAVLLLSLVISACHPDEPTPESGLHIEKGVLVLNEGTYMYANSSLTYYNPEADTSMNNLFYRINGAPIGDVGQSMAIINGNLYIVVNNSNYIYKVDANSMVCDTTKPYILGDFYSPRYILPLAPDKAYVSDLSGNNLWIIDPSDMSHTGTIDMGKPTETMVMVGNEVYVTNWSNYYNNAVDNNTVMVVDANQNIKVAEITVGKEPNGMVVDSDGMVWVLCEGAFWDEDAEDPSLWQINPWTKTATCKLTFDASAMNLAVDPQGEYLYCFLKGDVRRISVSSATLDESFCIPAEGRTFYKIAVNPANGEIYVSDAKNYMVSGTVYRYSSDGVLLSSFNAGICPGFILFRS